MPSFSNQIAPNLQPLCDVYISKSVEVKNRQAIQLDLNEVLKNKYKALIDTGANRSCISDRISDSLSLKIFQNEEVINTSGTVTSPVYEISLYLPSVTGRRQTGDGQTQETVEMRGFMKQRVIQITHNERNIFDVIIGMDIISQGHLTIVGNIFHFSY